MVTRADPPAQEATARLLAAVGYRGPANLQFITRDGVPVVHDVNLRIGAAVAMAIRAGLDVPARAAMDALGRDLPAPRPREGVLYIAQMDELTAVRNALRDRDRDELGRVVRRLAAAGPGAVRDPRPLDPFPYAAVPLDAARRLRRRVTSRR